MAHQARRSTGGVPFLSEPEGNHDHVPVLRHVDRRNERNVAAHIHGGTALKACLEAGVPSVEHGMLCTEENVTLVASINVPCRFDEVRTYRSIGAIRGGSCFFECGDLVAEGDTLAVPRGFLEAEIEHILAPKDGIASSSFCWRETRRRVRVKRLPSPPIDNQGSGLWQDGTTS